MKEAGRRAKACVPLASGKASKWAFAPAARPGPTARANTYTSAWQARRSASESKFKVNKDPIKFLAAF